GSHRLTSGSSTRILLHKTPVVDNRPSAGGGDMKLRSRSVVRTFISLVAVVAATAMTSSFAQQSGGEVVFAVPREADMLHLHVGSSRYDLVAAAQIYDTYLFLSPEGEFLPWLAEEVTVNDDATQYTIRLRPGVVFHDGTPLNAEAVKFNF